MRSCRRPKTRRRGMESYNTFWMSQVLTDAQVSLRNWQTVAGFIDHTLLKSEATADQIVRLCEEAACFNFAAVCVKPWWIGLAVSVLHGTPVKIATTIGFPLGANHTTVKRFEAAEAIRLGAHEVDMVMNIGALRSGDRQGGQNDIAAVAADAHGSSVIGQRNRGTPALLMTART